MTQQNIKELFHILVVLILHVIDHGRVEQEEQIMHKNHHTYKSRQFFLSSATLFPTVGCHYISQQMQTFYKRTVMFPCCISRCTGDSFSLK